MGKTSDMTTFGNCTSVDSEFAEAGVVTLSNLQNELEADVESSDVLISEVAEKHQGKKPLAILGKY